MATIRIILRELPTLGADLLYLLFANLAVMKPPPPI